MREMGCFYGPLQSENALSKSACAKKFKSNRSFCIS